MDAMSNRVVVLAVIAAMVLAACSSGKTKKAPTTNTSAAATSSTEPTTEVTATAYSPERDSVQGVGGVGMVVALAFRSRDASLLQAQNRTTGGAKPGRNAAFANLVVTLSTTDPSLGGPAANLADLFQTIGVSKQADGSSEVFATWINAKPLFGVDVDSVLEAYVVRGPAPPTVPEGQTRLDVISNVINVSFHLGPPAGGAEVGTSTTARGQTTSTVRGVTSSTRPRATTSIPRSPTSTSRVTTTTSATIITTSTTG